MSIAGYEDIYGVGSAAPTQPLTQGLSARGQTLEFLYRACGPDNMACDVYWDTQTGQFPIFQNCSIEPGNCGAPLPPGGVPPQTVDTCVGPMTLAFLTSQLQGAGYPGPYDDLAAMLAAFSRAVCAGGNVKCCGLVPSQQVTLCDGRTLTVQQLADELKKAGYNGSYASLSDMLAAYKNANVTKSGCGSATTTPPPASQNVTLCTGRVVTLAQLKAELTAPAVGYGGPFDAESMLLAFARANKSVAACAAIANKVGTGTVGTAAPPSSTLILVAGLAVVGVLAIAIAQQGRRKALVAVT